MIARLLLLICSFFVFGFACFFRGVGDGGGGGICLFGGHLGRFHGHQYAKHFLWTTFHGLSRCLIIHEVGGKNVSTTVSLLKPPYGPAIRGLN